MDQSRQFQSNIIYPILSLFSGGGFLDLGFINQGFEVAQAVEIEPNFIKSYNFAFHNYFCKSTNPYITSSRLKHYPIEKSIDVSNDLEQKKLVSEHSGICGLIGGPPCQDYSVGGKNAGIEGEKGKLINSYLKLVKKIRPKFLFFENVEGLYKVKRHRAAFDKFVEALEAAGYTVFHDILNVIDYGHPQDRPRIALVAFRRDIVSKLKKAGYLIEKNNSLLKGDRNEKYIFRWPQPTHENVKKMIWPKKVPFGSEIEIIKPIANYELCVASAFADLNDSIPNQSEFFNPKSYRFLKIFEGDTNRKSFKRLHRFKYSPTVAYGNNEVHLHPTEARRLTVREALRLQTVPDIYVLPSEIPLTHKFKLISNGVPTAKAELIAAEIRRTLSLYDQIQ